MSFVSSYLKHCFSSFSLQDVKNVMQIHDLESGKVLQNIPLPICSVDGVHGRFKSHELFFKISSLINPGAIYFMDMSKESPEPEVQHFFLIHKLLVFGSDLFFR
jgi:hypothetical protein